MQLGASWPRADDTYPGAKEQAFLQAVKERTDADLSLVEKALHLIKEVRNLVKGVTRMESNQETFYQVLLSHPENIHRLLGAEDPRVLYVKLADRMHNLPSRRSLTRANAELPRRRCSSLCPWRNESGFMELLRS